MRRERGWDVENPRELMDEVVAQMFLGTAAWIGKVQKNLDEEERSLYRDFVDAGVGLTRSPWEDLRAGVYLGSARFIARVEELTSQRAERMSDRQIQRDVRALDCDTIAGLVERHFETALTPRRWANDPARLAFAALARKEAVATFAAIANRLGITSPGARSLVARAFRLEASDREFRQLIETLRLRITELKTRV